MRKFPAETTSMSAATANETFLGRYRTHSFLGQGGMGMVYLGKHIHTGRDVVIKVMHDHLADDPQIRRQFQHEIQVMMRFRHPHVVQLLDAEFQGPRPCLVMEYIPGQSLEQQLERERRMPLGRLARLLGQLCSALHAAHGAGIIHGDLSPANLLLSNPGLSVEKLTVMDFGLSRLSNGFFLPLEKLKGQSNSIGGGTPDYMSPEQIRGDSVDQRGDLYSVGVILFQALTGKLPFLDDADMGTTIVIADILQAHLKKEPPPFSTFGVTEVPHRVEDYICKTLLAKYPAQRPGSARELAEQFGNLVGHPIADAESFTTTESAEPDGPDLDPRTILDRFKAWMPEQIAVMKLRGFVEGVGGEVIESLPGVIRVRLKDPRQPLRVEAKGFLSVLGLKRQILSDPHFLDISLYLERKQEGGRSMVEISLVMPAAPRECELEAATRRGFAERICRELRAYLMIGR